MLSSQPTLPIDKPYVNRRLFSDYYLDRVLPANPHWQALTSQAGLVLEQLKLLFAGYTRSKNEAQTEQDWVHPVLKALGHVYNVQAALKTADGVKKPDYVFYDNAFHADAAKGKTLDDRLPQQGGIAVGDAKYWDRPLDKAILENKADALSNKNPAYQIYFYVQQSGVAWGILTNGRIWRLVHKDTAHKLDCYYEVDLEDLLTAGNTEAFLYFYAFFSRAALEPANPLNISQILAQSTEYALGVGKTLKTQVFDALLHIAQGFLDFEGNKLATDADSLEKIYDNSLILLYRLLFILYAEGRGLLPVTVNSGYRETYGLYAVKIEGAKRIDAGQTLLASSNIFWPRLKLLFGYIDRGEPPLQISTFNGGLFDPEKHPFLEKFSVGDSHLISALDKLARVGKQFIDYRDLAVRHLGTIYEGLLEHHLSVDAPKPGWKISLLNDKGERKETGSYYTPDYIVKYIVEQAVGPLLDNAVVDKRSEADCIEAVLNIKVLDPSMGSGHFLVEAVEYIARYLVNLTPQESETGPSHDLTYWKRRVAQSCIYGVDLNPLAVELAKLSLWLTTVAQSLPLSFLDHHLRPGNALVGARLDDLQFANEQQPQKRGKSKTEKSESKGQLPLMQEDAFRQSMGIAVRNMWLIEANEAQNVSQVKEQEKLYDDLRTALTGKYGNLANVVTAVHFGGKVPSQLWKPLADYARGRNIAALPEISDMLETANAIAKERHFLHWELEFPEVFFDRHGRPLDAAAGFDAVIGNPPYISAPAMALKASETRKYLTSSMPFLTMKWDIYCAFLSRGWQMLSAEGSIGVIIPNQFLYQDYAAPLRHLFAFEASVKSVCDLGKTKVFEDATVMTCVVTLTKHIAKPEHVLNAIISQHKRLSSLTDLSSFPVAQGLFRELPGNVFRLNMDANSYSLVSKLQRNSVELGVLCYGSVGVVPHSEKLGKPKEDFIFSHKANDKCRRYLEGKDIDRYSTHWNGQWLEYDYNVVRRPSLPELLQTDKIALKIVAGRTGLNATYDAEGYFTDHSLVLFALKHQLSDIKTRKLEFTEQDKSLSAKHDLLFILALLNSTLLGWYFKAYLNSDLNIGPEDAKRLPIKSIQFSNPTEVLSKFADEITRLVGAGRYEDVLELAKTCLSAEPAQSDVVHDILAYLAQQMLDLNRQWQDALELFLIDLEGILTSAQMQKIGRLWTPDAAVSNPANPDSLQAEDLQMMNEGRRELGALAGKRLNLRTDVGALNETQWKWLLKQRLHKITNLAELVQVFRSRQPAIAALNARLIATDTLINNIVYALYDLSKEEIGTVEAGLTQAVSSDAETA